MINPIYAGKTYALPELPERGKPPRMPWAIMLIPVLMGMMMFTFTRSPFSLIFIDAASAREWPRQEIVELLDAGGMIVLDDFTPCPTWPPLVRGRVDNLRLEWLSDERFTSVDVMVAEDTSVLVAVRR